MTSRIISLAKSIRFCGIIDKLGEVTEGQYREGFEHLLTTEQQRKLFVVAAIRNLSRRQWDNQLGKLRYVINRYQKVTVITMPLWEGNQLFVTFDSGEEDYDAILRKKIIPLIEEFS